MTVTQTSLAAYLALWDSGRLGEMQYKVLLTIHELTPRMAAGVSRADLEIAMHDYSQSTGPRLKELERKGLIVCCGTKSSPKNKNRFVQCWKLTTEFDPGRVPPKRLSHKQVLQRLCVEVRRVLDTTGESDPDFALTEIAKALQQAYY